MIKQIQLRGISRTPSDRLSEDGGLSESLNMYMDTAENAPAFVPQDVTNKLGLPADLQADRIFIHKTPQYENYIAINKDKVLAYLYSANENYDPLLILTLGQNEEVQDINSLGNTIIISTSKDIYYALFNDKEYSFLGNKVPFPHINFFYKTGEFKSKEYKKEWTKPIMVSIPFDDREDEGEPKNPETPMDYGSSGKYYPEDLGVYSFYQIDKDDWDAKNADGNTDPVVKILLKEREALLKELTHEYTNATAFFIRYSIVLYDGSELSSMPILCSPAASIETTVNLQTEMLYNNSASLYAVQLNGYNSIQVKAWVRQTLGFNIDQEQVLNQWSDIVQKIRFYISKGIPVNEKPSFSYISPLGPVSKKIETGHFSELGNSFSHKKTLSQKGIITFDKTEDFEDSVLKASAEEFMVREIEVFNRKGNVSFSNEFAELLSKKEIDIRAFTVQNDEDYVQLETQRMLTGDDMKHYAIVPSSMELYNNQLLLTRASQFLDYDYNNLTSYRLFGDDETRCTFYVTFLVKTMREDKIIKKVFRYNPGGKAYAFQIFPDSRAYKMLVKAIIEKDNTTEVRYGEFDMFPHPYLDCAYYFSSIKEQLIDKCVSDNIKEYEDSRIEYLGNKLFVSEQNNPFVFPIESRYTFQSSVLGAAIATTALSQGQFGQYPLYVFTEDGIWAMETAADGSFVSQKPLSREVCSNPNSITSIDNAVVFVTKKAVMLIQGSEVINISPFMNGRHYEPNDSAKSIISKQEGFADLVTTIEDTDSFISFMQDAKVAYDYTGQRLIFISPANKDFQYLYKIDTQTWHKLSLDETFVDPLNSYPECYVSALGGTISRWTVWVDSPLDSEEEAETWVDDIYYDFRRFFPNGIGDLKVITEDAISKLLCGKIEIRDITNKKDATLVASTLNRWADRDAMIKEHQYVTTKILDMGTILSPDFNQKTAKGILITRPFDLGMPDVFKSIIDIRIRGDYDKGNVKYILQGSDDGRIFYTLTSLRGKSWKMFRIFILADLEPTERISWIDVDFEPRYNNRLR